MRQAPQGGSPDIIEHHPGAERAAALDARLAGEGAPRATDSGLAPVGRGVPRRRMISAQPFGQRARVVSPDHPRWDFDPGAEGALRTHSARHLELQAAVERSRQHVMQHAARRMPQLEDAADTRDHTAPHGGQTPRGLRAAVQAVGLSGAAAEVEGQGTSARAIGCSRPAGAAGVRTPGAADSRDTPAAPIGISHEARPGTDQAESARSERAAPDGNARRAQRVAAAALFVTVLAAVLYTGWLHRQVLTAQATAAAAARTAHEARTATERQLAASSERIERQLADVFAVAGTAERTTGIVAAPDARRMDLSGGQDARAASGHAVWSRSRGVLISAVRVPPPPPEAVYQVWVTTSRGSLSLGFAPPDARGRLHVTFDLPMELTAPVDGFLVTREPLGGSSSPRGAVILAG